MTTEAESVARLAGLLADRTRMTLLLALLDGRAWTMTELAQQAGVGASTASEQLSRLVDAGLLAQERQGRHRYLRLADPQVARMIEDLAGHATNRNPPVATSLRTVKASAALARGRTCYDHLAGRLGVAVIDGLVGRQLVDLIDGARLTPAGARWLTDLGVDVDRLRAARRPMLRTCLDWTERRPHLAGGVGAAIHDRFLARQWIAAGPTPRAVVVTKLGRRELPDLIGLEAGAFTP
jgi:DNA-binding transcriptional ArsR family regulator